MRTIVRPEDDCRIPVGVGLQSLAHFIVCENVECLEIRLDVCEYGHELATKTALGSGRVTLHEDHDRMKVDDRLEPIFQLHLFRDHRLQLPVFLHLLQDVEPANEIAVDVELRECRPVRELLQSLADFVVPGEEGGRSYYVRQTRISSFAVTSRCRSGRTLRRLTQVAPPWPG